MSLEEKRRLILSLDHLIRRKTPGTAIDMSRRLGVSRSTFFRLIEYMREDLVAPVSFDEDKGRYCYAQDGIIVIRFVPIEIIDMAKAKDILGGTVKHLINLI
ncbi:MAG: hypothetical protein WKF87_11355 [Chryseolinea sp.]